MSSPLLEQSVEGATGILLNITGGTDLGLFEVNEAAEIIQSAADQNSNIIFGAVVDDGIGDGVRVTVIATGFERPGPDAAVHRGLHRPPPRAAPPRREARRAPARVARDLRRRHRRSGIPEGLTEILPAQTARRLRGDARPAHPLRRRGGASSSRVDEVQRPQGYRLVGAFEDGRCLAVAGFRVIHNLAWGDTLYVDDLSTHPDGRRRGHGRALLEWCAAEEARLGCTEFHLDSGVGPEREDAHRLYFNSGPAHHELPLRAASLE